MSKRKTITREDGTKVQTNQRQLDPRPGARGPDGPYQRPGARDKRPSYARESDGS